MTTSPEGPSDDSGSVFDFAFDPAYRLAGLPFGVVPSRCRVEVTDTEVDVRFGPWRVRTPRANVVSATRTGPYAFLKTAGPAHLSVRDRGLTLATNGRRGVCLLLREPVPGLEPTGRLRHPGVTVTVRDVDGLATLVGREPGPGP